MSIGTDGNFIRDLPFFDWDYERFPEEDFQDYLDELRDEWDREYFDKKYPNPYETIEQLKASFLKGEISWDGCRETLLRFFGYKPSDTKSTVDSWAA
ncbi:hypothetical protein [Treponema sp. R6D11]